MGRPASSTATIVMKLRFVRRPLSGSRGFSATIEIPTSMDDVPTSFTEARSVTRSPTRTGNWKST